MVKKTPPATPKDKSLLAISYGYALLLTIMLITQLLTFETFVEIIGVYQQSGAVGPKVAASAIVLLEICALPFLLRLHLSPLARSLSAAASIAVPIAWLGMLLCAYYAGLSVMNTGFFGKLLAQPLDWWALVQAAAFVVLAVASFTILSGHTHFKHRLDKHKKLSKDA